MCLLQIVPDLPLNDEQLQQFEALTDPAARGLYVLSRGPGTCKTLLFLRPLVEPTCTMAASASTRYMLPLDAMTVSDQELQTANVYIIDNLQIVNVGVLN